MVCRAGLRLAEAISGLMTDTNSSQTADVMKSQFNTMDKIWADKRDEVNILYIIRLGAALFAV